jgi:hypothetical protein
VVLFTTAYGVRRTALGLQGSVLCVVASCGAASGELQLQCSRDSFYIYMKWKWCLTTRAGGAGARARAFSHLQLTNANYVILQAHTHHAPPQVSPICVLRSAGGRRHREIATSPPFPFVYSAPQLQQACTWQQPWLVQIDDVCVV